MTTYQVQAKTRFSDNKLGKQAWNSFHVWDRDPRLLPNHIQIGLELAFHCGWIASEASLNQIVFEACFYQVWIKFESLKNHIWIKLETMQINE